MDVLCVYNVYNFLVKLVIEFKTKAKDGSAILTIFVKDLPGDKHYALSILFHLVLQ